MSSQDEIHGDVDEQAPVVETQKQRAEREKAERQKRARNHPIDKEEWFKSDFLVTIDRPNASLMKTEDYLAITAYNDEYLAYWHDMHIDWCLELLRQKYQGLDDIFIGTLTQSHVLYQIWYKNAHPNAAERQPIPPQQEFWAQFEELSSRSIIVLPINSEIDEEAAIENLPEGHYKSLGAHWSFMVIDMRDPKNRISHYIDSLVETQVEGDKEIIIHHACYQTNAPIAGKILCGFDQLLGLDRGAFTATTLKWIPHQGYDNAAETDEGACGPYLYAFLRHLLKYRLIGEGLGQSFTREDAEANAVRFGFDSIKTRLKFQNKIWKERRRQEEEVNKEWHPYNLTPEVLRELLTQDLVHLLAGTYRPGTPRPSKHGDPKGNGGTGDDKDGDDTEDAEEYTEEEWDELLAHIAEHPDLYFGKLEKTEDEYDYAEAWEFYKKFKKSEKQPPKALKA